VVVPWDQSPQYRIPIGWGFHVLGLAAAAAAASVQKLYWRVVFHVVFVDLDCY
jgi:hypothetical protein